MGFGGCGTRPAARRRPVILVVARPLAGPADCRLCAAAVRWGPCLVERCAREGGGAAAPRQLTLPRHHRRLSDALRSRPLLGGNAARRNSRAQRAGRGRPSVPSRRRARRAARATHWGVRATQAGPQPPPSVARRAASNARLAREGGARRAGEAGARALAGRSSTEGQTQGPVWERTTKRQSVWACLFGQQTPN